MTSEQLQLLNRRISKQRGWHTLPDCGALHPPGAVDCGESIAGLTNYPPDWTGNNDASCVLLDEMLQSAGYDVIYDLLINRLYYENRTSDKRRIAVALAYCRWKEISLEWIV